MKKILILLLTLLSLSAALLAELTLNFDVATKEFYLTGSDSGTASDENLQNYGVLDIDYEGDKYSPLSYETYTDIEGLGRTLFTDSGLYLLNDEAPPPGNILWLSGGNYERNDSFINLRLAFSPPSSNQVKITGTGLRASYADLNPDLINDIENNNGLKLDLVDGAGFSEVLIRVHNQYSGIYEGDFQEYTPTYGPDGGIFLAYVDANNNVTMWTGNEYWADKYRFKIDEQGRGSFRSSDGYNVTMQFSSNRDQFSSNGGITITADKGASASVSNVTRVNYPYTPGAVSLLEDLMANPAYNSGTQVILDLNSSLPFESTTYTLEDQLSLLSGEWSVTAKMSLNDYYGTKVNAKGDFIFTQNSLYFYGKARGETLLIRQDASTSGYNDVSLSSAAYDFNKRTISASGAVIIQGYTGTVSYTAEQKVSYFDTDDDSLSDYDEINNYSTDPLKADSDKDGMSDYAELEAGTNPTDKSEYPAYLKVQVSLAKGITGDGDATVLIDDEPYPVSLVRGKGTLEVAMPTGSTYTVSASMDALTSGTPKSVLMNKASSLSLILDGDSDLDGLPDSQEARYKGKADNPDSDGDGILDGEEVYTYRTRVNDDDTDKDGFTDKQELDLGTNPLSSKDKPEAYIQRPVLVDLNLTYETADGYVVEKWDTAEMAYFLSSAVNDPQLGATIYLKYSLDGSNLKWIVRADSGDIDGSSLMRPIKVSKPAQLDGEVLSSIDPLTGDYSVTQMFSLAISAGKTKSLSLVVSGESSFSAVGPNVSGVEIDLATSSDYKALGLLKDPTMSDGPILIEGTLTMGDELANVLGQIIGSVD